MRFKAFFFIRLRSNATGSKHNNLAGNLLQQKSLAVWVGPMDFKN